MQDIGTYWDTRSTMLGLPLESYPQVPGLNETIHPQQAASDAYVDENLIAELEVVETSFALDKLLTLLRELNANYAARHIYASLMLWRAIIDHIPPAFGQPKFDQVVANHAWGQTDRGYLKQLDTARKAADDALHRQIRTTRSRLSMSDMPPRTAMNALLEGLRAHLGKPSSATP